MATTIHTPPDLRLTLAMARYFDRASHVYTHRRRPERAERYHTHARRYHARALAAALARGGRR